MIKILLIIIVITVIAAVINGLISEQPQSTYEKSYSTNNTNKKVDVDEQIYRTEKLINSENNDELHYGLSEKDEKLLGLLAMGAGWVLGEKLFQKKNKKHSYKKYDKYFSEYYIAPDEEDL